MDDKQAELLIELAREYLHIYHEDPQMTVQEMIDDLENSLPDKP